MGVQTLAEFRESLNLGLAEQKQSSNRPLDNWINAGYYEALGSVWAELEKEIAVASSIAGQHIYGLPDDVFAIQSILYTPTTPGKAVKSLLYIDWNEFQRLDRTKTDTPVRYTRRGPALYLWPTPKVADDQIEIQYIQEDCVLSASTDVTILPARYDRLVHLLALKSALYDLGQIERAVIIGQEADRFRRSVMSEEKERAGARQVGMNVAESWNDLQNVRSDGY